MRVGSSICAGRNDQRAGWREYTENSSGYALVIWEGDGRMRPLTGAALGLCAPATAQPTAGTSDLAEAVRIMSEPEPRPGLVPRPVPPASGGYDDEEPPSRPRRHHLWQHI